MKMLLLVGLTLLAACSSATSPTEPLCSKKGVSGLGGLATSLDCRELSDYRLSR